MVTRSHEGLVRINNEDCVHADPSAGFAVLADGMGGLMAGEEASAVAVESVCRDIADAAHRPEETAAMETIILTAHEAVLSHAQTLNYEGKMGTTLVVWVQIEGKQLVGHVGDSRAYGWDGTELTQHTADHTLAQRMIDMGQFPADQAYRAPNRHVLTQAVGLPGVCVPTCRWVRPDGRVLLCSDGLSDMVDHTRLTQLIEEPDLETCADGLLAEALARGGKDNVSLAVIDL